MNLETTRNLLKEVDKAVCAVPELESLSDDWRDSALTYAANESDG